MASRNAEQATVTIPAAYIEDVRSALVAEIDSDGGMLRTNQVELLQSADRDTADRDSAVGYLSRDLQLLSGLLGATEDTDATGQRPDLRTVLEELVRILTRRLGDVSEYAPIPLRDVLDVADELRWAAQEAIRVLPAGDDRLTRKDRLGPEAVA